MTTLASALCGLPSGIRLWPVVGRQCNRSSLASTAPGSALCGPPSGIRLRPGSGRRSEYSSLASTAPSSALCGPQSSIRLPPGVGRGARGARWLRQLHHLRSAGPFWHPAPAGCGAAERWRLTGFDSSIIYTRQAAILHSAPAKCWAAERVKLAGYHLHLLAAVRHPAAGCGAAARGELAAIDKSITCTLRAAVRHPAPAGCGAAARGELAGFDSSITCSPRVAVRHPAPAGCGWAVRKELGCFDSSIICTLLAVSGIRLRPGEGRQRAGSSLASTAPSSALCGAPSGIRLQPGVG